MMVAVALVLLMMTMFAQIFQMATGSLSTQKGIAENDQRERMVTTILRGDLDKRTFRDVFPFNATSTSLGSNNFEDTRTLPRSLPRRAGYFEIYEGDPTNDMDDYLQFTASVNIKLQNKDGTPFTGKSTFTSGGTVSPNFNSTVAITAISSSNGNNIFDTITVSGSFTNLTHIWVTGSSGNDGRYTVLKTTPQGGGTTTILLNTAYLSLPNGNPNVLGSVYLTELNEPDVDDGIYGNGSSVSTAAEVCYFLRNGNLYRRVLLIRDPSPGIDAQPSFSNGQSLFGSPANYPGNDFWNDLDYSAFYFNGNLPNGTTVPAGVRFHNTADSLSNSSESPSNISVTSILTSNKSSFPMSLGIPNLRYGHGLTTGFSQDIFMPVITGTTMPVTRFTAQECANTSFGYPGIMPATGSPFENSSLTYDQPTGLISQFKSQLNRRGDDILMSNVLTFDIKVWDPSPQGATSGVAVTAQTGAFVDIGDSTVFPNGSFASTTSNPNTWLNTQYGGTAGHFRFDTWHPRAFADSTGSNPNANLPPLVPYMDPFGTKNPRPFVISALQITINFKDLASNQVRQTTIIHSLLDQVKTWPSTTFEPPEE